MMLFMVFVFAMSEKQANFSSQIVVNAINAYYPLVYTGKLLTSISAYTLMFKSIPTETMCGFPFNGGLKYHIICIGFLSSS